MRLKITLVAAAVLLALGSVPGANSVVPDDVLVYLIDCDIKDGNATEENNTQNSIMSELYQWNIPFIKAEAAWDINTLGQGVKIAVIDSGVFADHPDLNGTLINEGYNYFTNDSNTGYDALHGTRVAGIIMATRDNALGINGIADRVQIVPLKCFENEMTSLSKIVQAIYDAIDKYGCSILNMSFGTYINSKELSDAMEYAEEKGVITIAAVGNKGDATVYYPAGYDTVIGVGGLATDGSVSKSSQKNKSVMVTAPGEKIVSTAYSKAGAEQYTTEGGTSFSAPQVSALAGIVRSINPEITPAEFRELLISTVDDFGLSGWDNSYGYGRINVYRTITTLLDSMLLANIDADSYRLEVTDTATKVTCEDETGVCDVEITDYLALVNTTRADKRATLFIVIYDDKHKLIALTSAEVKLKGFGMDYSEQLNVRFQADLKHQYTKKVFLWDFMSLLPLSDSTESTVRPQIE